jgi:hypothetical protein
MTQLSHPDMTRAYLHQQGQQLRLRAERHHAVYHNRPPTSRRTNPARRPRPVIARFVAAAHRLRFGWAPRPRSQTPEQAKAST